MKVFQAHNPVKSHQMRRSASITTWYLCLDTLVSVTTKFTARAKGRVACTTERGTRDIGGAPWVFQHPGTRNRRGKHDDYGVRVIAQPRRVLCIIIWVC